MYRWFQTTRVTLSYFIFQVEAILYRLLAISKITWSIKGSTTWESKG